jgi:hypothetical protein
VNVFKHTFLLKIWILQDIQPCCVLESHVLVLYGICNGLGPVGGLQFGKNAADVGFDGGEVDNQGFGDLLVAFSLHTPEEWVYSEKK